MLIAYNQDGHIVGVWEGEQPLKYYMPDMEGKYGELIIPYDDDIYKSWYKYKVVEGRLVRKGVE